MPRGLDHIVHAVRDLEAAAEFYRRAGFTVGARNRHAWGTHNYIIQFPGVFIELIAIGEPELIRIGAPGTFSFGAFLRDFLAREEGLAMLVLEGKGAAEDVAAFRAAGIGNFKPFNFERDARSPDGSLIKVAFSLAFAADEKAPDIGYFTCQQHHPENFWNPAFQQHANGAIAGIVMVSENPEDHRHFVSSFAGEHHIDTDANGISVTTPRGVIQVIDPSAWRATSGTEPPDLTRGAHLAAIRFMVRDKAAATSELKNSGVAVTERDGRVVVPPRAAYGATLMFETPK
jgi:catechol 2,3-dioxygenase-like lactoylglutathione lyase family enzyme